MVWQWGDGNAPVWTARSKMESEMGKPSGRPGKGNNKDNGGDGDTGGDTGAAIEGSVTIIGTDGDDELTGSDGDDLLIGMEGNDFMDGGEGGDTYLVSGFQGVDTIMDSGLEVVGDPVPGEPMANWDVLLAGKKGTVFYMSSFSSINGIEEISAGGFGGVDIRGTAGDNVLDFSETLLTGIAFINGLGGDDVITGSWGDDFILGGGGNDTLDGGGGDDWLWGNSGSDTFVLNGPDDGVDTIVDFTVGEDVIDLSGVDGVIEYDQRGDDAVMSVNGSDFAVFLDTATADLPDLM